MDPWRGEVTPQIPIKYNDRAKIELVEKMKTIFFILFKKKCGENIQKSAVNDPKSYQKLIKGD